VNAAKGLLFYFRPEKVNVNKIIKSDAKSTFPIFSHQTMNNDFKDYLIILLLRQHEDCIIVQKCGSLFKDRKNTISVTNKL